MSGVPPFIPNELLEAELRRFGKFGSGFKMLQFGVKGPQTEARSLPVAASVHVPGLADPNPGSFFQGETR